MKPEPFRPAAFRGRAGVARRDITPPPGIYSRNWGTAPTSTAQGIHQPLMLAALAIGEEDEAVPPFVLLSLDLGWWRSKVEEDAFGRIPIELGLDPARFIVALSHTHAGPIFCPGEADKPGGDLIAPYLAELCHKAAAAVREAIDSVRPALIEAATGRCALATNRDLKDSDADRYLVGWNPGVPADDLLLVARVTDLTGKMVATLVNYACHPTILAWDNVLISPDYVGTLTRVIERETGAPCLFLQGASGELSPALQYVGNPDVAEAAGRSAGHAALSVLHGMLPPGTELVFGGVVESGAPLAVWKTGPRADVPNRTAALSPVIDLPIKPDFPTLAQIENALSTTTDRVTRERLCRQRLVRKAWNDNTTYPAPHLAWRLGDLFIVAVPNEAYSVLQQHLRAVVAPHPLLVITLANGGRGYLCPRECYGENRYPVWQSPFAAGSLELVINRLADALRTLADF